MTQITKNKYRSCYKCRQWKPLGEFYGKGNILLHCESCRESRAAYKKKEIQALLRKEKELS